MRTLPPLDKGLEYVYRLPTGSYFEFKEGLYEVGAEDGVFTNCYLLTPEKRVWHRFGMFSVVRPVNVANKNKKKKEKKNNEMQILQQGANGSGINPQE